MLYDEIMYPEDVERIVSAYKDLEGIVLEPSSAEKLWSDYSESMACGWCGTIENMEYSDIILYTKEYLSKEKYYIYKINAEYLIPTGDSFDSEDKALNFVSDNSDCYILKQ